MEDDTENLDGDATTDKSLNVTSFSANSTFPTGAQPLRLLTLNRLKPANACTPTPPADRNADVA